MSRNKKQTAEKAPQGANPHGTLFVVATPIGNLEDISLRALRVLREVDLIAAEDTRQTRKLLTRFNIKIPTLSYYKEKEQSRSAVIIDKLRQGLNVALVSDAGTPGISDPGAILVKKVLAENINIIPIPGPSSLTAALSVAGLAGSPFVFLGFAPSRKKPRQDLLRSMQQENKPMIFFEAPHRLGSFLQDCLDIMGDRPMFWGRELTKIHEEITWDTISGALARCISGKIRGESVIIISGASDAPPVTEAELDEIIASYKKSGGKSLKDAVQEISAVYDLSRSAVYQKALKIWQNN